jgi:hypothetical protein
MIADIQVSDNSIDIDEKNLRITVLKSLADFTQFNVSRTELVIVANVPWTKKNQEVFDFAENPNVEGRYDRRRKESAKIFLFGNLFAQGFCMMQEPLIKQGYVIKIFADIKNVHDILASTGMRQLDLSSQDHKATVANIDTSELVSVDSRWYVWGLFDFGDMSTPGQVDVPDRIPGLRFYNLINQIYLEQGYDVDSVFLETTEFQKYFSFNPLSVFTTGYADDNQMSAALPADQAIFSLTTINDSATRGFRITDSADFESSDVGFNNILNEWVIQQDSEYKFSATIDYTITNWSSLTPSTACGFSTKLEAGFQVISGTTTNNVLTEILLADGVQTATVTSGTLSLNAGDKIRCIMKWSQCYVDDNGVFTVTIVVASATSIFSTDIGSGIPWKEDLFMKDFVPDVSQLSFIKAVQHMFNLYYFIDTKSQTIKIEPRDSFFNNYAEDWSGKLDTSFLPKTKYLGTTLKKRLKWRYITDDNDEYVKEYLNGALLDARTVTLESEFLNEIGFTNYINSVFSPTLMHTSEHIGLDNTEIPRMWKEFISDETSPPDQAFNWLPRVLKYEGITNTNGGDTWSWRGTSRSNYPKFTNVSFNDLVDDYYDGAIETFNDGIELELYFKLSYFDIQNADLTVPIFIESEQPEFAMFNGCWIINEIKANILSNNSAKVSLISIKGFACHKLPDLTLLDDINNKILVDVNGKRLMGRIQ